jgi:hypothetical protein
MDDAKDWAEDCSAVLFCGKTLPRAQGGGCEGLEAACMIFALYNGFELDWPQTSKVFLNG